jgi:hypothetical protein
MLDDLTVERLKKLRQTSRHAAARPLAVKRA